MPNRHARVLAIGLLSALLFSACRITITEVLPTATVGPTSTPVVLVQAAPSSTPLPTGAPPSPTPTVTPTATPPTIANGPAVNYAEVVEENINSDAIEWFKFEIANDNREPVIGETLTANVTLTAEQAQGFMWDSWWCAADDSLLQGTLVNMDFFYRVNGVDLDVEQQGYIYTQYTTSGSICRVTVFYLTNWPSGTHTLEYVFSVKQRVSDGFRNYPPADYVTQYTVVVP